MKTKWHNPYKATKNTVRVQLTADSVLLTTIPFQLKFILKNNYGGMVFSFGYDALHQVVTYPNWR